MNQETVEQNLQLEVKMGMFSLESKHSSTCQNKILSPWSLEHNKIAKTINIYICTKQLN